MAVAAQMAGLYDGGVHDSDVEDDGGDVGPEEGGRERKGGGFGEARKAGVDREEGRGQR